MKKGKCILSFLIISYIIVTVAIPFKPKIKIFTTYGDIILAIAIFYYLFLILLDTERRKNIKQNLKDFFTDYLSLSMLILLLIMVISILYSYDKRIAINETARFLTYIFLFYIIKYECNSEKERKIYLTVYIALCTFIGILGISQSFTGKGVADRFKGFTYAKIRVVATLDNPNNLGAFMVLGLFPVLALFLGEKINFKKLYYGICSLIMITTIILTFSRNALIGLAVGLFVLTILYSWKFIPLLIGFGACFLFVPQVRQRLADIKSVQQDISRLDLWGIGIKMIKEHPILGVGNGNYVSLYDDYVRKYPQYKYLTYSQFASHNSYLKVESELGICGIASFLWLLVSAVFKVKKFVKIVDNNFEKLFFKGFIASLIAFYCMNFVDNLLFVSKTPSYFWLLLAISQAGIYKELLKNKA